MATSDFDKVWEQAKALSPLEQWRLLDMLEAMLTLPPEPMTEEEFELALARKGIITLPSSSAPTPRAARKLVEVKGKPLSETIIEERR